MRVGSRYSLFHRALILLHGSSSRRPRNARRPRRHWYIDPNVQYFNFYDGEWRYPGRPGFYRGRYNGGSIGAGWTQTPIGPVWTCG
jgi:hypothetical protein